MKFFIFTVLCIFVGVLAMHEANAAPKSYEDYEVEEPIIVPQKVHQTGKNPCTWGPSYFCKNEERARQCKQEKLCKGKYEEY